MANTVAVNIKRKKKIKLSSRSKVSGMKWNLLSSMFCLDVCLSPCFRVLVSKTGRIKFDAVWVEIVFQKTHVKCTISM